MRNLIAVLAIILTAVSVNAQSEDRQERKETKKLEYKEARKDKRAHMEARIEAKKIGFITTELDLSTEEAQRFWPIYNEYSKERKALRSDRQSHLKNELDEISESDAVSILASELEREESELALKRKYMSKLGTAVSKKKLVKLLQVEHQFRKEVLDSVKRKMKRKKGEKAKKDGNF